MMVALLWCVFLLLLCTSTWAQEPLKGEISAVYNSLERVLPGASNHFNLQFGTCNVNATNVVCLSTLNDKLLVEGTTASEVAYGVGWYLRELCNMTIGWPRGGGSSLSIPTKWPSIKPTLKRRVAPYSYLMNVCTHSYSLAWYDWNDWQSFIDWMSLTGINLMLALTGQEEVQYKVFRQLGVTDQEIRTWFNGPAFLAWSRGQNEYGNNICGPLPHSFMKRQWEMQRNHILPRLRSLGITGMLPGFQGNVPIALKNIYKDANITQEGDTGWMDALDPLYGKIADLWMKILVEDFGTDHWYQLDGYFDGSTAPWMTTTRDNHYDLAFRRGVAAYTGLNRTDPHAVWAYQGWQIIGWSTNDQANFVKGFVNSVPKDKFVVIDMSPHGEGQWKQWNNSAFFGANFVWTTLHNFGGTSGIKGDFYTINRIPFHGPSTRMIGTGASPEGIDQNPAYYQFIFDQNFREAPATDLSSYLVEYSHKRYGLFKKNEHVARAWTLLLQSAYGRDVSTQDGTGIPHLQPGEGTSLFKSNRFTPKPVFCKIFEAWHHLILAAAQKDVIHPSEPFTYDLVNLGREVLAQIATPAALNFSDATSRTTIDLNEVLATGNFYFELLKDTDTLVATDRAFLLGPWLESARRWGNGAQDCGSMDCEHFFEWNARTQLTTWIPVPSQNASRIPGGPLDYASKHWSGLIRDYYAKRASLLLQEALMGHTLNRTKVDQVFAAHAYNWTNARNGYSTVPVGDSLTMSRRMYEKYRRLFSSCQIDDDISETKVAR